MSYGALFYVDPGVHINWNINNVFQIMKTAGNQLKSKEFQFAGKLWGMSILFNGNILLSLNLLEDLDEKTEIQCSLGVKKFDGSIYRNRDKAVEFHNMQHNAYTFDISKDKLLASTDVLSRGDKILTVYCNLRLTDNNGVFINTSWRPPVNLQEVSSQTSALESIETLSDNFKELLVSGQYSDVTFHVGSKQFKAHKSVLAARSPVLESMFSHEMLESSSGSVNIDDCDEATFQDFLVFLYSGKLDHISAGTAVGLYTMADKYDLKPLREESAKRLEIDMSIDSVCDTLRVGILHNEQGLLKTATEFFMENADAILKTPKWKSFLMDHFEFGNELFIKCLSKVKK